MAEKMQIQMPCWFCQQGMDQYCMDPMPGEARGKYGRIEIYLYTCQGHRLRFSIIGKAVRYIAKKARKNHRKP